IEDAAQPPSAAPRPAPPEPVPPPAPGPIPFRPSRAGRALTYLLSGIDLTLRGIVGPGRRLRRSLAREDVSLHGGRFETRPTQFLIRVVRYFDRSAQRALRGVKKLPTTIMRGANLRLVRASNLDQLLRRFDSLQAKLVHQDQLNAIAEQEIDRLNQEATARRAKHSNRLVQLKRLAEQVREEHAVDVQQI